MPASNCCAGILFSIFSPLHHNDIVMLVPDLDGLFLKEGVKVWTPALHAQNLLDDDGDIAVCSVIDVEKSHRTRVQLPSRDLKI